MLTLLASMNAIELPSTATASTARGVATLRARAVGAILAGAAITDTKAVARETVISRAAELRP
jgi:sugar phosphate permease